MFIYLCRKKFQKPFFHSKQDEKLSLFSKFSCSTILCYIYQEQNTTPTDDFLLVFFSDHQTRIFWPLHCLGISISINYPYRLIPRTFVGFFSNPTINKLMQEMVLCWVDSNLWSGRAPDFWPWECVQDSSQIRLIQACCLQHIPMAENLEQGLIRCYWRPNSEVFWAYHYISTLGWTFFMENHFPVATCHRFPPKFKIMTCVYFIGKNSNSWQVFTSYPGCHGKEKTRSRLEWKCNGQPGKNIINWHCFYWL